MGICAGSPEPSSIKKWISNIFMCWLIASTVLARTSIGLNIFIHISIYSNIQIYILQYNHDGIQKEVMRLMRTGLVLTHSMYMVCL